VIHQITFTTSTADPQLVSKAAATYQVLVIAVNDLGVIIAWDEDAVTVA
jgi:hypothetical protein